MTAGLHDVQRTVVYLAVIGSMTFLANAGVVSGDAAIALLGGVAGYAAGRIANGGKAPA